MSVFKQRVDHFCKEHSLSKISKLKLLYHYPLFKASWLSQHSHGLIKKTSKGLIRATKPYKLRFNLKTASHENQKIQIPFLWDELNSFQEIFFGKEYESPWNLSQCKTLVDAGANIGFASQYFLSKAPLEKIILVEANPELTAQLKHGFLNHFKHCEVIVKENCLSGNSGEKLTFSINENHRDSGINLYSTPLKSIEVTTLSLSDLLTSQKLDKVDILKMDIEGAEFDVQKRDSEAFRRFHFLFFEVHGDRQKRDQFAGAFDQTVFESFRPEPDRHKDCEILFIRNKNF